MSGGHFPVPLVIRMATGAGRQLAAQHSHSLEGWYAHIPGLRILAPATLEDARGMLWTALESRTRCSSSSTRPSTTWKESSTGAGAGGDRPRAPCAAREGRDAHHLRRDPRQALEAAALSRRRGSTPRSSTCGRCARSTRATILASVAEDPPRGRRGRRLEEREPLGRDLRPDRRGRLLRPRCAGRPRLHRRRSPSPTRSISRTPRSCSRPRSPPPPAPRWGSRMAEFRMPSLGADMEAGTLIAMARQARRPVKRGRPRRRRPDGEGRRGRRDLRPAGRSRRSIVAEGDKVPVGALLATIRGEGEAPAVTLRRGGAPARAAAPLAPRRRRRGPGASPAARAARRRARRRSRALHRDRPGRRGHDRRRGGGRAPRGRKPPEPRRRPDRSAAMRRAIAAAMSRSNREIPHYYLGTEIDMGGRPRVARRSERAARAVTERILLAALLLKAVALAAREMPEINGFLSDGCFRPERRGAPGRGDLRCATAASSRRPSTTPTTKSLDGPHDRACAISSRGPGRAR